MTLALRARRVAGVLLTVVVGLSLASAAGQLSKYVLGHGRLGGLVPLVYVGAARSLPGWVASLLLLVAALLAAALASARARGPEAPWWRGLAALLAAAALDVGLGLHALAARALGMTPAAREVVGWALVLAVVLAFAGFVLRLPARTRRLLVLAGALHATAALGLERLAAGLVAGAGPEIAAGHRRVHGRETPLLALLTSVEGVLALSADAVLVYALLAQLAADAGELRVRLDATPR